MVESSPTTEDRFSEGKVTFEKLPAYRLTPFSMGWRMWLLLLVALSWNGNLPTFTDRVHSI
jgi:hypothetical protein